MGSEKGRNALQEVQGKGSDIEGEGDSCIKGDINVRGHDRGLDIRGEGACKGRD